MMMICIGVLFLFWLLMNVVIANIDINTNQITKVWTVNGCNFAVVKYTSKYTAECDRGNRQLQKKPVQISLQPQQENLFMCAPVRPKIEKLK